MARKPTFILGFKQQTAMKTLLFILTVFLITTIFVDQASAQGVGGGYGSVPDSLLELKVENIKTHKRILLVVGQNAKYRRRSSTHFEKGLITEITDSTISFENKKSGKGTFMHKDLTAFKVPKSTRKKFKGYVLMVGGAWVLLGVSLNPAQGKLAVLNIIGYAVGLVAIVKGHSIKRDERVYLDESWLWTLKAAEPIDTITPGQVVSVTLKNGEIVEEMKVDEIDAEKIKGVQISHNSRQQFVYTTRTIMIADMVVINKR